MKAAKPRAKWLVKSQLNTIGKTTRTMVSRENKLITGFVLVAFVLLFVLSQYTSLAFEWVMGVVFLVGILIPQILLQYTNLGAE
ncbi:hypothetical protein SAMN04487949_3044 [Halogranum gelatinilyticum]|uniref:Uncharacterized protein n=1 Tax=Halogranum gelatinilyticum TaxID=660521 RepID=A0A1G9XMI3_9EURY|nr:hypothetical protein [Halogranum gelatinilyticum]SDM97711.1 hypothetical protein SAMN04487949_3044 [Halogranum gelatinilyticum]